MKVTVPKEVAEAIDFLKEHDDNIPYVLYRVSKDKPIIDANCGTLTGLDIYTIMSALVNGYEIEKSPEEKLREYYSESEDRRRISQGFGNEKRYLGRKEGVNKTLDILGITIEGINGEESE